MDKFVKVLLYGEFGSGKTTTAMRYDNNARVYATDGGHVTALKHPDLVKYENLDIVPFEARSQLMAEEFDSGHTSIILDTYSEMVDIYLDTLVEHASWGGKYRSRIVSNHKEVKGVESLAPADYNVIRNMWRPVARKYLQAPVDVFFLTHEKVPIEGLGSDTTIRPYLPNETWKAVAKDCRVVGRVIRKKGQVYIDIAEDTSRLVGKSQIDGITGQMTQDDFIQKLQDWKVS